MVGSIKHHHVRVGGTKRCVKSSGSVEKIEGTIVVGVVGGGCGRDA